MDPGALTGGKSRPGGHNDNDDSIREEDTQGCEKGTGKRKGAKDGKGNQKATQDGKGKGKAMDQRKWQGKGNSNGKGKGIVQQSSGG